MVRDRLALTIDPLTCTHVHTDNLWPSRMIVRYDSVEMERWLCAAFGCLVASASPDVVANPPVRRSRYPFPPSFGTTDSRSDGAHSDYGR